MREKGSLRGRQMRAPSRKLANCSLYRTQSDRSRCMRGPDSRSEELGCLGIDGGDVTTGKGSVDYC